jgi:uncharacterized protein (DUF1015 family)
VTATFAPFRAFRYSAEHIGDIGAVWAPPYDVITPEGAAELRSKSPYNIVRVTNPQGDGNDRYRTAARTLDTWTAEGVLARDARAAYYVHRHSFELGEESLARDTDAYVRTGVWGLLKLEPFGGGVVLPHEQTMTGPKADRLALMDACRAQLSPIFFICSDPGGRISELLRDSGPKEPEVRTEFPARQAQEVWRVDSDGRVDELAALMREQVFLIADGHHRYETALAYRDRLVERGAPTTGRQAHEFLMAYVVPEGDPGLLLLPTHRVVSGGSVDWDTAMSRAAEWFDVKRLSENELDSLEGMLIGEMGRPTFVLVIRGQVGGWHLRLRDADATSSVPSVAFHDAFMSGAAGIRREDQIERTTFVKDVEAAVASVRSGSAEAAALLAAPRVAQVREAAAAGERLPPKTTYFWPKVPTGMAVHRIDPSEVVV